MGLYLGGGVKSGLIFGGGGAEKLRYNVKCIFSHANPLFNERLSDLPFVRRF